MATGEMKIDPDQSYFSDAYLFSPSMYFVGGFSLFLYCFGVGELKFRSEMCLDMHGKFTSGIMHELWLEQLLC